MGTTVPMKNLAEESKKCLFNKECTNHLCQYQHDTFKNVEALTDTANHDNKEKRKNVHFLTKSIEITNHESFIYTSTPKKKRLECETCINKSQCTVCYVDNYIQNMKKVDMTHFED